MTNGEFLMTKENKMEAPNTKHQIPKQFQAPISKLRHQKLVLDLGIGISLELGHWPLGIHTRDLRLRLNTNH